MPLVAINTIVVFKKRGSNIMLVEFQSGNYSVKSAVLSPTELPTLVALANYTLIDSPNLHH